MSQQVVIGITALDVHEAAPGPRPVNASVRRRGQSRRAIASGLAGAAVLGAALAFGLVLSGQEPLGLAVLPAVVALAWASGAVWQSSEHLAATVREGVVVPARARVLRGPDEVELSFAVAGRHPAWHQLFPPHGDEPITLMLHYEVDGREYLAVDLVEPGDRVACVSHGGHVTPAVLVRRDRPDRPVILTEQTLYAPPV